MFHRQPDHRDHVGDDQDDVLRHLGPGHRTHTAQERADQDTGQADIHAHVEGQTGQAGCDQAHAKDLRHHVHEGHQDGRKHANQTRHVAAVASTQEVRNRELAKLAQVRRQEQGHQTVTAGPAQNEGQTTVTGQVKRTGHTDEGRRRHPVRAGGHTVVNGGHASAGHIVFGRVVGATHHTDAAVQEHGGRQEGVTDVLFGHAHLFKDGQHDDESRKAPDVEREYPVQGFLKLALALAFSAENAHDSSPSETPYSSSSLFI